MNKANAIREKAGEQIINDLGEGFIGSREAGPALFRLGYDLDEIWEAVQVATENRALKLLQESS